MTDTARINLLYLAGTVFMLLFCLTPIIYMVLTAATSGVDFLQQPGRLELTFAHFKNVLFTPSLHFPAYLANSLIISGVSAALSVVIAAPAAYAMTRLFLPGKMVLLFAILAVSMFPQISLISYLFKLMAVLGWINTLQALILPYTAWILPLSLWILTSYFAQIPTDLDRAALIDGCNRRQALQKVILPVAAPGIFSTALLAFIFAFNELLFALMLTTDHHARTVPVGIALFQGLHGEIPWGNLMAAATLTTLPVVALTIVFQRRIVQGLTRGAVKG